MIRHGLFTLRAYVADGAYVVAGLFARVAKAVEGRPAARLVLDAPIGSSALALDRRIPRFTRGLKLEGASLEIVNVKAVEGNVVVIDRPLCQAYAPGSVVKVLL